jgi:CheY-like chemotaxis protein/anti-sigma regulatory factor (Ser/Thr protein kinase)
LRFEPADAVLHTDSVLLERVLSNLISNALRYTPAGSVEVRCRPRGDGVAIEVADTGPGIAREEHERVFDEFYQLGNPERDRRKGLGLGLATVKRIAQLLGCSVTLDSQPGKGSVFAITAPRGDRAQVIAPPVPQTAADLDALRDKVIAVVDDERDVREGLAELLATWRCKPVVAASARELLELLELSGLRPDAVIADHRLRERETGLGAVAALRERFGAWLPALIMSGDTTPEIFQMAREQQLPLLSKPVRAARLRAALQHLLSIGREASRAGGLTPAATPLS